MFPLNILDSVYQMANIYETVLACFLFDFFFKLYCEFG